MTGAIGLATQALGAGLKVFGGIAEMRSQQWASRAKRQLDLIDAEEAERQGEYEASQISLEGRRMRARQLVQYAKSGVMPDGTPKLVMNETSVLADRDAGVARNEGQKKAHKIKMGVAMETERASAAKAQSIFSMLGSGAQSGYDLYKGAKDLGWM